MSHQLVLVIWATPTELGHSPSLCSPTLWQTANANYEDIGSTLDDFVFVFEAWRTMRKTKDGRG